jgi:hypothetical protein
VTSIRDELTGIAEGVLVEHRMEPMRCCAPAVADAFHGLTIPRLVQP